MEIGAYIGIGVAIVILGPIITFLWISRRREKNAPPEQRRQAVLDDLRQNESNTGTTWLDASSHPGVSADELRQLAEEAGYQWKGTSGGAEGPYRTNFQRLLPGQESQRETAHRDDFPDTGVDPTAGFLARLDRTEPDVNGIASVDVSGMPRMKWSEFQELAATRGWKALRVDSDNKDHWLFQRLNTTKVESHQAYFITGPPLSELRKNPQARAEAERSKRELGLDPLSDIELEKARATHQRMTKRARRHGLLFALPLLLAFIIVPAANAADSGVAIITGAILLAVMIIGLVLMVRSTRELKTAVHPYKKAYERVAAAAFGKQAPMEDR